MKRKLAKKGAYLKLAQSSWRSEMKRRGGA
jgi:hypothetical protein